MDLLFSGSGIRKQYPKSKFTLSMDSLELYAGTITGVVGENGNGKTTLLSIVAGELLSEGKLDYAGMDQGDWSRIKDKIAFIPQRIPRWYGSLYHNLCLKAALEGIPSGQIDDHLQGLLEFLHLLPYKDLTWSEISTGYRLRFELARVMIGKPQLMVLDEPIANLDINTQQKFLSDLKAIMQSKDYPVAIILSSQQLHEIESVADHMVFLRDGHAVFSGNVSSLSENQEFDIIEIQVLDDPKLEAYLNEHQTTYRKKGEYYQIDLPKGSSKNEYLSSLFRNGFDLKYYRDISNSTKRLFSE